MWGRLWSCFLGFLSSCEVWGVCRFLGGLGVQDKEGNIILTMCLLRQLEG